MVGDLKLQVLTAVKMSILVIGVVTPCVLVGGYRRFGGTYCLHLQGGVNMEAIRSFETFVTT
jgi:hypothetical protein